MPKTNSSTALTKREVEALHMLFKRHEVYPSLDFVSFNKMPITMEKLEEKGLVSSKWSVFSGSEWKITPAGRAAIKISN